LAFTDFETEQLRKVLLKKTRHCAVSFWKNTTLCPSAALLLPLGLYAD